MMANINFIIAATVVPFNGTYRVEDLVVVDNYYEAPLGRVLMWAKDDVLIPMEDHITLNDKAQDLQQHFDKDLLHRFRVEIINNFNSGFSKKNEFIKFINNSF